MMDELSGGRTCPVLTVSALCGLVRLDEFALSPGCHEELGWPVGHMQSSSELTMF